MSEDRECRILVVSASLDQARAAVKLIKAFVDDTSDLPTSNSIPWTIRNRYYSADVHFHLVQYAHWDPQSALRVPAVIFVWIRGQPYAEQVFALQNGLARFEPEVALAIALGHEPPHHDDPPEGPDSFLADHGFEYIDGERTRRAEIITSASASAPTSEEDADADDGVQGLGRVVDALSTIMWPTMVREQRDNSSVGGGGLGGKRKSQLQPSLFDFDDLLRVEEGEDGEEETLAALMEADAAEQGVPLPRARRLQREMAALERWLVENEEMHEAEYARTIGIDIDDDNDSHDQDEEEDNDEHDVRQVHDGGDAPPSVVQPSVPDIRPPSVTDPWVAALSSTSHPTTTPPPTAALPYSHVTTQSSGFDDDFSVFISAPPAISIAGSAAIATTATTSAPAAAVTVTTTAPASASTSVPVATSGSIPPAPLHGAQTNPTQMLLFPSHTGGSFRSWRSATSGFDIGEDGGYEALDDRSSLNVSLEHEHAFDDGVGVTPRASIGQRSGERAAGLGDVPLDLTDMLGTLQTMREDVAGIEDEAERRAITARFASEFVFKRMGVDGDEREDIEH